MKELVRHIERLLLNNDCVVVPQLGGFVTSNVSAKYIVDEELFLPPMRSIVFNEKLKADDNLLLNSYMSVYACDERVARKKIGMQICEIQQELWETGTCDLGSIGVLNLDEYNQLQFSPCQAGVVCPVYYGFDALEIKTKQHVESKTEERKTQKVISSDESNQEITIRLKKSWLQNAVAVAAMIIMFFMLTPNVQNTSSIGENKADFANLMMFSTLQEIVTKENPIQVDLSKGDSQRYDDVQAQVEPTEEITNIVYKENNIVEKGYCVVVASAIPESNANAYVEQLERIGQKGAKVYKKSGMVRVVFPGFDTEVGARKRLNELSDASEEFAYAWIYFIK